jgi:hypothetical protein
VKRIDKIKDDKTRLKLEKLASRLYEILLEAESQSSKEQQ